MIITKITGGTGNQLFQYAAGRRLAHKLNTELKLDNSLRDVPNQMPFGLDKFNIKATFATPEEIASLKKINLMTQQGYFLAKVDKYYSLEEILNAPDNTYIQGWWDPSYFKDAEDIIRKDLTLKDPLSPRAEAYKQKILSAECSVAMHFRHGDYIYNPFYRGNRNFAWIPPLEKYCDCLEILKPLYKNITVFVFSNNIPFIKRNLHLDVPIEFVQGLAHDVEDLYLMSLCHHCIKPFSTFSHWSAWLNQYPSKKIFQLNASDAKTVENWHITLSPEQKDKPMWIGVPFDREKDIGTNVEMRPIFSLCLVVNNDAATIAETLDSLLNQTYKYYELIIIDNASTDSSGKICRQKIAGKKNVTYRRLHSKVKNAEAWNIANSIWAEGQYVSFLKGDETFSLNALETFYYPTERRPDIIHSLVHLEENEKGSMTFNDKKFLQQRDPYFQKATKNLPVQNGEEAAKMMITRQINDFLGTKFFYRKFLAENKIKFAKQLDDTKAETLFLMEAFFKSQFITYMPNAFYVKPFFEQYSFQTLEDDTAYNAKIIDRVKPYITARIDIAFMSMEGEFKIVSISDKKASVNDAGWYKNIGGVGYWIHSYAGQLEIVVKSTVDGTVRIVLLGRHVFIPNEKLTIPYWIDYTKLIVNGEIKFKTLTPAWHNKPYSLRLETKANEEIKIQLEWLPHRSDT